MCRLVLLPTLLVLTGSVCLGEDDKQTEPVAIPPARQLYAALEAQARTHFQARRAEVATLKTPDEIARRSADLRIKLREALGEFPERTPLNPKIFSREEREGYSVEKVVYESRPGHHVTALLYLPEGKPPFPGVLVPCGHEANGKAGEAYQRVSILMAKNGLAVLCYDPIGQGERAQLLTESGKPAFSGSTAEHTAVGIGALLVGRSVAGYRVWDGIRSLDYLASRPEVDATRLGCTGNSGGGTLTSYLMALDDRIAVAAPSCFITSLERLFATIGPQDGEQNLVGQVADGIEHADFVTMRAPKPTLLCVGTRDFFDIKGSWDTYQEVKRIYGKLGYGERVDLFESDETHGFTRPRREAALRWMRRWLLGKNEATKEQDFPIASDDQALCTSTGQVLRQFHGRSVFDLNAERADALAKARLSTPRERTALLAEVRTLIALDPKPGTIKPGRVAAKSNEINVRKYEIETEPGITVPAQLFLPTSNQDPLTYIVGGDRKELTAPGGLVEREIKAGRRVLLADVRGTGDTAPTGSTSKALGAFGPDWQEAFLGLHLRRPLLGQRVGDLISVLDALNIKTEVHLIGIESAAPIALHAAALDRRITRLTLDRPVISWTAVASTASTRGDLANVIPGALKVYDLPDLAATLAPRPLTINSAVDPTGKPVSQQTLEAAYARCRESYRAASAEKDFKLEARP